MSDEVDTLMGQSTVETYMPVATDTMALAAIIEAIRAQTKTVERQSNKLDNVTESVTKMREDIAVMKARDEQFSALAALTADLTGRLTAIELRNAQQDGAGKFLAWLKDFGPWFVGGVVGLLAALGKLQIG